MSIFIHSLCMWCYTGTTYIQYKKKVLLFPSLLSFFFLFYKSLNRGRKSSQFVQPICLESRTYGDRIIQPSYDERNLRSELRYRLCTFKIPIVTFDTGLLTFFVRLKYTQKRYTFNHPCNDFHFNIPFSCLVLVVE